MQTGFSVCNDKSLELVWHRGQNPAPGVRAGYSRSKTMQSTAASAAQTLEEKIKSRTARVGIIGLGYVGLPLAMEFAKAGFVVTGIDIEQSKVSQLNRGQSYVQDVP